jgi:5-methyltetrahydropteroyltriglutamate--homocysteine methyltransferase
MTGIQHSTDRILATHVGSLPRPHDLLDVLKVKASGGAYDRATYDRLLRSSVADCVKRQADCGIDVVTDGELSKTGFFAYMRTRLTGFEPRPGRRSTSFAAEEAAFPEYYADYFKQAMLGGGIVPLSPVACTGPIRYVGQEDLQKDIANLKAAAAGVPHRAVFMPASAPSGAGANEYYASDEEYFQAVGSAFRTEYQAIIDAGFLLQVDDPGLTELFGDPTFDEAQRRRRASLYVESVNEALRGLPVERIRYHTCYGINHGPRIHDASMAEVVGYMLKVNAGSYSFESGNARHEHEYHVWENVKLPPDKVILPGVITHSSSIVEHPELIAERIVRFAERVGRENVVASADCGFSSQATYKTEIHPKVVWAKFEALREGANLASKRLWR